MSERKKLIEHLINEFRRYTGLSESDAVVRDVIPPDFDVPEWSAPFYKKSFSSKVIFFDSIKILEGVGQVKIRIGASFYLIDVHKDYMELFEATSTWSWVRRLNAFNRAINSSVELKKLVEPAVIIELMGDGVNFIPQMIIVERCGDYLSP